MFHQLTSLLPSELGSITVHLVEVHAPKLGTGRCASGQSTN